MTYEEACNHFGSCNKLAKALGVHQTSALAWKHGIPQLRQLQIEALSGGDLRADPSCDAFRVKPKARTRRQPATQE